MFARHLSRVLTAVRDLYPNLRAADAMGISESTLYGYRSNVDKTPLNVEKLHALIDDLWAAGCYDAAADLLGYFAQPGLKITVDTETAERAALKRRIEQVALSAAAAAGEVSASTMAALADNVVTDDEAAEVAAKIKASRATLDELEAAINGRNKGGK